MIKIVIRSRDLHSRVATLYLQSWMRAPGSWRGGWPCQMAGLAPLYLPARPLDPLTLLHWAWNKQTNTQHAWDLVK